MSTFRNQVQLIGNLGKDLDFKTIENGNKMVRGPIATNEFYKNNKGEKIQETQCHNLVAWGKTAELMDSLLKKGDEVAVHGKLVHRKYEDSEGNSKYITEIVVNEFVKMSKADAA